MTLVDASTGEILTPLLDEAQARRIVARINGTTAELIDLIEQAWRGQAWVALGYASWADLCDAEIEIPRLDRERRVEMVGALRSVGMSTRAIAAATGAARNTVMGDLKVAQSEPPAESKPDPRDAYDRMREAMVAKVRPIDEPKKITGTDGKTYTAPPPQSKPKRSPLTDAAQKAGWEFRKATERLERLVADDRFAANKEQVAAHLHGHLSYALEVCQDLLDQLDHQS